MSAIGRREVETYVATLEETVFSFSPYDVVIADGGFATVERKVAVSMSAVL